MRRGPRRRPPSRRRSRSARPPSPPWAWRSRRSFAPRRGRPQSSTRSTSRWPSSRAPSSPRGRCPPSWRPSRTCFPSLTSSSSTSGSSRVARRRRPRSSASRASSSRSSSRSRSSASNGTSSTGRSRRGSTGSAWSRRPATRGGSRSSGASSTPGPRTASASAVSRCSGTNRGRDLRGEALDLLGSRLLGTEDEGVDVQAYGPVGEGLDPVLRGAFEELPARPFRDPPRDVVEAADRSRVAPGFLGGLVDSLLALRELLGRRVPQRGHPAVRPAPDELEAPALVDAEPDLDTVRRRWPGLPAGDPVVLAFEAHRVLAAPRETDDLYRLLEGAQRLAGTPARAPHRRDPVPERPGAETELEPPAGEAVERGRSLGDHGRRAPAQGGPRRGHRRPPPP